MKIRPEQETDVAAVREVNISAFGTASEANLVDALRKQATPIVSLVAEKNRTVVGHIMFSPVSLTSHPDVKIIGLAPMAVMPAHQRNGIGTELVRAGLDQCQQLGFVAAVVLGHPAYYPRFGFCPSSRFAIDCEYDVPAEAFMAMELQPGVFDGRTGKIKYHAAFSSL